MPTGNNTNHHFTESTFKASHPKLQIPNPPAIVLTYTNIANKNPQHRHSDTLHRSHRKPFSRVLRPFELASKDDDDDEPEHKPKPPTTGQL